MTIKNDQNLSYEFDTVNHGVIEGINDAVMITYDTHIPTTIAREAIQNILDARKVKPVIAELHLEKWEISDIPDVKELKNIFKACLDFWPRDVDCKVNFESALKALNRNHIQVLIISDYNTIGLAGGDEDTNGDYFNFLRSQGSSAKGCTGAGSFGLGKGSFYAASKLKMIYVSSIYDNNKVVFQGKLRLVSHKMKGQTKRASGSYGLLNEKPVRVKKLVPKQFYRSKQGTSIYVPGFKHSEKWEDEMIRSILNNFWYAIYKGDLVVKIQDKKINSSELDDYMHTYFDIDSIGGATGINPLPYYETYTDVDHHIKYEADLHTLGKVQLFLLPQEGYPKKVACFRLNRMLIETKIFRSPVGYAGVFICDNKKGNEILRKMEPPNHNEWNVNNTHSKIDGLPLEDAENADKELRQFIRAKVKELSDISTDAQLSIPGITKYLFLPGEEDRETGPQEASNDDGEGTEKETANQQGISGRHAKLEVSPREKAPVIRFRTTGNLEPGDLTGVGTGDKPGGGKKKKKGGGTGTSGGTSGKPGNGDDELRELKGVDYRTFASPNKKTGYDHVVILRGKPNTKCRIKIKAGTDDSFDDVDIKTATNDNNNNLPLQNGMITNVKIDRSGSAKFTLNLAYNEKYSLRAIVYEDK